VPLSFEGGGGLSFFLSRQLQLRSASFLVVHDVVAAAAGPGLPPSPSPRIKGRALSISLSLSLSSWHLSNRPGLDSWPKYAPRPDHELAWCGDERTVTPLATDGDWDVSVDTPARGIGI
jgi:hypothetical protein